ncbi:MAG: twin-arginine translocase subunit TatC, partial [Halobacteriota archaeon]|nr:twin-arginine translocase subunit TatC [Halobacteriota archaeon]
IKIAVVCGVLAALPLILYYLVKVVNERIRPVDFNLKSRDIVTIAFFAVVLFLIGASYSYFMMLPFFFNYVYQMALNAGVISSWSIAPFINFVVLMTAVFGTVFELPLILTLLVRGGVIELDTLKKYRRHAYVALLVLASIITSPDIFTQVIIGLPLILFYEISIFVARFASGDEREYDQDMMGNYAFKGGVLMSAGIISGMALTIFFSLASNPQSILGFIGTSVPIVGLMNLQETIFLPMIIPTISGLFLSLRARNIGDLSNSEQGGRGKSISIVGIIAILVSATLWAMMFLGTFFGIGDPINIPGNSQAYTSAIIIFIGVGAVASFISIFLTSYNRSNMKIVMPGAIASAFMLIVITMISTQLTLTSLIYGSLLAGTVSILCGHLAKLSLIRE